MADFDTEQQHGWLLLDDGTRLDFPPEAFAADLRLGQRVKIERGPAGEVTRVTVATLP